ncbi:MAG: SIMPL domain-containing protein [Candidatus Acidiferrales bacterium]
MNGSNPVKHGEMVILGLLLALGLILGGWALGAQIKATRLGDRYVSVRGLAERNVKSNFAVWPIGFKEVGDNLPTLYSKAEADRKVILQFLSQQDIVSSEIELGIVRVVDTQANEYGGGNQPSHRYIVDQQITVMTSRVDQVAAAAQKTMILVQQGIALNGGFGQGLTFRFTGLNSIKPDMITEATRNARAAAVRFASDSGSTVGSIRQANQGIFSILPANSGGDTGESGENGSYGFNADSSIMKTVRVVTSVEYYLEK